MPKELKQDTNSKLRDLSIYDIAKIAFNVKEGIDAYYLMYAYYKQVTGETLPKAIGGHHTEQEALKILLVDLILAGNGVEIRNQLVNDKLLIKGGSEKKEKELSPVPDWYNFAHLRELIVIYYQELDFKICHETFKKDWELKTGKKIAFPLWDYPEVYNSMIIYLEQCIEDQELTKPKYPVKLRKKDVKEKYGWTDKIFDEFYSQPFEIKQFKPEGSPYFVTSYIYNGNVIDEIIETEEYQLFIQKRSKKL